MLIDMSTRSQGLTVTRIADRTASQQTTFQGHVTSSVTWTFDSPWAISYWSFETRDL